MRAKTPDTDYPEHDLTLRQVDQARSDFAAILEELDFVKERLARLLAAVAAIGAPLCWWGDEQEQSDLRGCSYVQQQGMLFFDP